MDSDIASPVPTGFWVRAGAYYVDMALCGLPFAVWIMSRGVPQSEDPAFLPFNAAMVAVVIGYETVFLAALGRTPGKMAAGAVVLRATGEPIGFGRALGRVLSRYVCLLTLGLGYVAAAFTPNKRGLHDYIAGTRVAYAGEVSTARKALTIVLGLGLSVLVAALPGLKGNLAARSAPPPAATP